MCCNAIVSLHFDTKLLVKISVTRQVKSSVNLMPYFTKTDYLYLVFYSCKVLFIQVNISLIKLETVKFTKKEHSARSNAWRH